MQPDNCYDEAMEDVAKYRTRLQTDFPDLAIESVEIIGQGWNHVALEVNGSLIFRMPKAVFGISDPAKVQREVAVLGLLGLDSIVNTPDPKYVAPDKAYFGYPKLPGVLLMGLLPTFTPADSDRLKLEWVKIAQAIHASLNLEQARSLEIPLFDSAPFIQSAQEIYDFVTLDDATDKFVQAVLTQAKAIDIETQRLSFIHNDLHFKNMLADPATERVTGVIDWTDMCIAPIEREFSIWEWTHHDEVASVAALYEQETGIKIDVDQARLWRHLEEISDFVEQSKSGDREGAMHSMAHIMQWMQEGHW